MPFLRWIPLFFLAAPVAWAKPAEPRPITVVVTNATEVAARSEGTIVVGLASLFVDVEDKVLEAILARLSEALQARGIQAVVGKTSVVIDPQAAVGWYQWDAEKATLAPAVTREGTYRGLVIAITNPKGVVKQEKGAATLVAAQLLAVDVSSKVNQTVGAVVLEELTKAGVDAMVSF